MMMVLEFLNIFGNLFDIKDEFPSGLTFGNVFTIDILCIQSDIDDVIIMILSTCFCVMFGQNWTSSVCVEDDNYFIHQT